MSSGLMWFWSDLMWSNVPCCDVWCLYVFFFVFFFVSRKHEILITLHHETIDDRVVWWDVCFAVLCCLYADFFYTFCASECKIPHISIYYNLMCCFCAVQRCCAVVFVHMLYVVFCTFLFLENMKCHRIWNVKFIFVYICQDTKISEIMRPRVEVVAIEANSTMMDLYMLHQVRGAYTHTYIHDYTHDDTAVGNVQMRCGLLRWLSVWRCGWVIIHVFFFFFVHVVCTTIRMICIRMYIQVIYLHSLEKWLVGWSRVTFVFVWSVSIVFLFCSGVFACLWGGCGGGWPRGRPPSLLACTCSTCCVKGVRHCPLRRWCRSVLLSWHRCCRRRSRRSVDAYAVSYATTVCGSSREWWRPWRYSYYCGVASYNGCDSPLLRPAGAFSLLQPECFLCMHACLRALFFLYQYIQ